MEKGSPKASAIKHLKQPSLRDTMLGKKVTKYLPENFHEKLLDLELKLKREFTMPCLQELVNYYSVIFDNFRWLLNIMKVLKMQNIKITKID